jgi:putative sporulation protein YtxC
LEQLSIITDTKAIHDTLLEKISSEIGNEATVDVGKNSVVLKSKDEHSKEKIVNAITKTIVEQYENKLISKLINQNYFYFNLPDRKRIYKKALNYTGNDAAFNTLVNTKLKEYLGTTDKLMIDGFVNFRLKDYQNELEEVIDKAVDDFMVEKEYKEFIKLLKYFVEIQNPKYNIINIIPSGENYHIYNEAFEDITALCSKDFLKGDDEKISSDDLLISILISVAPRKICIHKCECITNTELISTIKQVFCKKVTICGGCKFCDN